MRPGRHAACLAVLGLAACAPAPPFPSGAVEHGPYLDRTNEGYVVNAIYRDGITILTVQDAANAPLPTPEDIDESWTLLRANDVNGPFDLSAIAAEAPRFETAAQKTAEVPGWCRVNSTFSFLPAAGDPLGAPLKIRATYNGDISAYVFAGQCR